MPGVHLTNIIVVFRKIDDARNIRNVLMRSGFTVTAVCSTGIQAIGQFDTLKNGIVICGYQMADMLYSEIRDNLPEDFEMLLMAREDVLPSLRGNDVICLPLPVRIRDLTETIAMMQRTIEVRLKKRHSGARARSQKENELIEQAKSILMSRNNMTEPEAHRYLQKSAMDTGTTIVETAGMVMDLFNV